MDARRHPGLETRVVVKLGQAKTARKVVRPDQHRVEVQHRQELVEAGQRRSALDVDNKKRVSVPPFQVGAQFRLQRRDIVQRGREPLALDGPQFHRPAERLRLRNDLDIKGNDAAGQHRAGQIGIG